MPSFVYLWKYEINPRFRKEFLRSYSSDGVWTKLFDQAEGYQKTLLVEDVNNSNKFVTMDFWDSKEAYEEFKENYRDEFDQLDIECEQFTIREVFLGNYIISLSDNIEN